MKKFITLLLLTVLLFNSSCAKDNDTNPDTDPDNQQVDYTYDNQYIVNNYVLKDNEHVGEWSMNPWGFNEESISRWLSDNIILKIKKDSSVSHFWGKSCVYTDTVITVLEQYSNNSAINQGDKLNIVEYYGVTPENKLKKGNYYIVVYSDGTQERLELHFPDLDNLRPRPPYLKDDTEYIMVIDENYLVNSETMSSIRFEYQVDSPISDFEGKYIYYYAYDVSKEWYDIISDPSSQYQSGYDDTYYRDCCKMLYEKYILSSSS